MSWVDLAEFYYRWFWLITTLGALLVFLVWRLILWISGASEENKALNEEVADVDKTWDRGW
jgi:hypothetical protein